MQYILNHDIKFSTWLRLEKICHSFSHDGTDLVYIGETLLGYKRPHGGRAMTQTWCKEKCIIFNYFEWHNNE